MAINKQCVIYIAGPFRGKTAWDVECNIRAAECVGLKVAKLGAIPLIPHSMFRYWNGQINDQFWIDGTLELLSRCDAVLMMPDWQSSAGSQGERNWAINHGVPLFYVQMYGSYHIPIQVDDWVEKWKSDQELRRQQMEAEAYR